MVEDMIMPGDMICCNVGNTPTFMTSMGSVILDMTLASVGTSVKINEWRVLKDTIK